MKSEVVRFLIAGGTAAALNWGARYVCSWFVPYEVAVVLAFLVGLLSGFLLMRGWVFGAAEAPLPKQFATYVAVNLLALLQTLVISSVLARWLLPAIGIERYAAGIAHAVGIAVPVVTSFVGHKKATFRKPETR
ncbi:MAG TPA: GtrA family protein [Polyangiaceae bacterium]|jgi:putative flippase GtrA|nr:GtrA family protein [Polyangiaceae bacterium]